MSRQLATKEAVSVASTAARHEERRRTRRVRIEVTARVRTFYETPELCGELLKVRDVSRNGFYFVSSRAGYRFSAGGSPFASCPANSRISEFMAGVCDFHTKQS